MLTPPHRYERFRALLHACGHSRAGCWIRAGACGACVVPDARLRVQRARAAFRGRPPTPCAPSLCTLGTAARTPLTARWQVISDAPFGPSFDHEIVPQQQLSVTAPVSLFCTAQVIWLNGQELVRGGERPRVAVSFEQAPHAAAVMLLSVVVIKSRSLPISPFTGSLRKTISFAMSCDRCSPCLTLAHPHAARPPLSPNYRRSPSQSIPISSSLQT